MIKLYERTVFRPQLGEVVAIEWTGENLKEVCDFLGWDFTDVNKLWFEIHADFLDYIVRVGGSQLIFPLKPDIFEAIYEVVP